jgi:DNA-binding NtrC family response regulator
MKPATPALIYVVQRHNPQLLQEPLERAVEPHCVVRVFSDPRQALQSFASETQKPELSITGLVLEGMLWHELLKECKALNPSLKVIVYSAMTIFPGVDSMIEVSTGIIVGRD